MAEFEQPQMRHQDDGWGSAARGLCMRIPCIGRHAFVILHRTDPCHPWQQSRERLPGLQLHELPAGAELAP